MANKAWQRAAFADREIVALGEGLGIDMDHVTIGLIGLGTVGTGVARLLTEHADRIARRAGRSVRWNWAAVRDLDKPRDVRLDGVRADHRCRRG